MFTNIKLTINHQILTKSGWVRLDEFRLGTEVLLINKQGNLTYTPISTITQVYEEITANVIESPNGNRIDIMATPLAEQFPGYGEPSFLVSHLVHGLDLFRRGTIDFPHLIALLYLEDSFITPVQQLQMIVHTRGKTYFNDDKRHTFLFDKAGQEYFMALANEVGYNPFTLLEDGKIEGDFGSHITLEEILPIDYTGNVRQQASDILMAILHSGCGEILNGIEAWDIETDRDYLDRLSIYSGIRINILKSSIELKPLTLPIEEAFESIKMVMQQNIACLPFSVTGIAVRYGKNVTVLK